MTDLVTLRTPELEPIIHHQTSRGLVATISPVMINLFLACPKFTFSFQFCEPWSGAEEAFPCAECGLVYKSRDLELHTQFQHPELFRNCKKKAKMCAWCNEKRGDDADYERHLFLHHLLPGVRCLTCSKIFPGLTAVQIHLFSGCEGLARLLSSSAGKHQLGRGRAGQRRRLQSSPRSFTCRSPVITRSRARKLRSRVRQASLGH